MNKEGKRVSTNHVVDQQRGVRPMNIDLLTPSEPLIPVMLSRYAATSFKSDAMPVDAMDSFPLLILL